MYTDPIADYLTRIRNSQMAGHKVVDIPSSKMKRAITEILFNKGYILNYKFMQHFCCLFNKLPFCVPK